MNELHAILNNASISYLKITIAMVQLKGNLTHAGNPHALFMHVARTRLCVYMQVYTHAKG